MDRRFFLLGMMLVVVSIAALALVSMPSLITSAGSLHVILGPLKDAYAPFQVNSTGPFEIAYNSTLPIDFYIMNATAFQSTYSYIIRNESLNQISLQMIGKGLFYRNMNSTYGSYPYNYSSGLATSLIRANGSPLNIGNYVAVMENPNANTANVLLVIAFGNNENLSNIFISSTIAVIILFIGLGLMVYAFLRRSKEKTNQATKAEEEIDKEVEELYNKIERSKRRKKN